MILSIAEAINPYAPVRKRGQKAGAERPLDFDQGEAADSLVTLP
jgi:hypothetical protein